MRRFLQGDNMNSKIYDIRENNDLTQEELAKIIGGNRVSISNWENEKEIPNINKANEIANYFDISLDYLFNLSKIKNYSDNKKCNIDKIVVGNRLKEFRKEHNLTISKLAAELNTTPSTISAYESGKTLLLTAFAVQICKKYKISMDYLYGKKDDK